MAKRTPKSRQQGNPKDDSRINLGRKPASKAEAWTALTPEAKQALFELRKTHPEMGGTPGQAPYWWSQEYGNKAASIEARHYIEAALVAWRGRIRDLFREYLG